MQIRATHEGPQVQIIMEAGADEDDAFMGSDLRIIMTADVSYFRRFWGELGQTLEQAERGGF